MPFKRTYIFILLSISIILSVFCEQTRPRVAVIPFSAINIEQSNAMTVTGLFETALVKTGAYTVIEQSKIEELLKTQKISLSGFADKQNTIELGKLLTAEQLIFGELSKIGTEYVLNVKVVDVTTGMNINSDSVKTTTLSDVTEKVELLAYKIAGLTYNSGNSLKIAKNFRELFIMTNPQGATIYINGVKKGVSPDLFEKIPLGNIRIEAEKGKLYGRLDVNVTEDMDILEIPMKETYGKLYIKSDIKNLNVYIDGIFLDTLKTGYFTGIPVGGHDIVVGGDGYFWWNYVYVNADKTTIVKVTPLEYGKLTYNIQEDAFAKISNNYGYKQTISGDGELYLFKGEYEINVFGENYEPQEFTYFVGRNDKTTLNPILKYNKDYYNNLFSNKIKKLRENLEKPTNVADSQIEELKKLQTEIKKNRFKFDEFLKEVQGLLENAIKRKERQEKLAKLKEIKARRIEILNEIDRLKNKKQERKKYGWISAGTSIASAGLFGLFSILGNQAYDNYESATITSDAVKYKDEFQRWDIFSYISLGISVAGAGTSIYLFFSKDNIDQLNKEYVSLGFEMANLEGELK